MTQLSRRILLKTGLAAAGAAPFTGFNAFAQNTGAQTSPAAENFGLPILGKLAPRTSLSIQASPLSIGFETLDRKVFEPEKTYAHLAALGVKWARCQTGWARTERRKGEYDFAWLDGVVDSLLKIGIQPWFNFGYGNKLYTPEAKTEYAVGFVPLYQPEARAAWVKYTQTIAERYRNRVRHWEIWNEPNIANFWQPTKPNPAELVKLTAPEIRKRVPNAVIVGGSLASMPIDYLVNYTSQDRASTMTNYKGVLRGTQYTPKPSYFAYQNLCSLFDAETKAADLMIRSAGVQDEQVFTAGFIRRGAPIFVRWIPVSLQQDKPLRRSYAELWSGKTAKMSEPVLVDLLSGQIHKTGKATFSDGWWKIENLPLTDYPLVITDKSVVQA